MANSVKRLTARQVESLAAAGRHADGANLYLQITPTGAKSWIFIYRRGKKQRELGLGSTVRVSLAEARQKAEDARRTLAAGGDPLEARHIANAARKAAETTFASFTADYIASHRSGWSSAKHARQFEATLGPAYCPKLQHRPIGEIDVDDVLQALTPIWLLKPETARRIRMRLERVLDAAKVRGLRSGENPARWRGHLDHLLPKHSRLSKRHFRALPYVEVPGFIRDLTVRPAMAARALEYLVLTASRTSEVLQAQWSEIDFEARVWSIPASRMKSRRPHRVPLSGRALSVLESVKGKHERFIFPGPSGQRPLSSMALLALLHRMGKTADTTTHGFRSAFRDWAAETTSFPAEVVEMSLAHATASATEAAYRRGDLYTKRVALMAAWGAYCTGSTAGNVIDLAAAKAAAP